MRVKRHSRLQRATTTSASRATCARSAQKVGGCRRSAGGDGGTTLFRSVRSDEDGGNPASIAASRADPIASVGKSRAAARRRREQRRSSSARDDDGGGSTARLREQSQKLEGAGHPATPSGPPLTNTLQAPGRKPFHRKRGRLESPSTADLAPKGRLTYLEHCGKCATTNSRRTMSGLLKPPT
jgi:hypothetical protein